MIKKDSSHLYELIKSMTKGEKRVFKQFANYATSGAKKYLILFNIIDSCKEYDTAVIDQKLKAKADVAVVPALKNYLQELILRYLRFHRSVATVENKIAEYIADADILHSKGLAKFRDKSLRRAFDLAQIYEKHEILLTILKKEWNYKLIIIPKEISSEYLQTMEILTRSLQFRQLFYNVSMLLEKGEIRDHTLQKEWDQIAENPLMKMDPETLSYEEKFIFYHNLMRYYHRKREFIKNCYYQELLIKHFESRPDLLAEYKTEYIWELNGLIVSYCQNNNFDKTKATLSKLLEIQNWELTEPETTALYDISLIALGNVMYGFATFHFEEILKIAIHAEEILKTKSTSNKNKSFIFLNLAKIYIYKGNFDEALHWNNLILNETSVNYREDYNIISRIFNLIIHYELGNYEILPSLIHSTFHFLKRKNRLFKVETIIMNFLKVLLRQSFVKTQKELISSFQILKSQFEEIINDPFESIAFEYFDYNLWLESKIQNKPLTDILKNRTHVYSQNSIHVKNDLEK